MGNTSVKLRLLTLIRIAYVEENQYGRYVILGYTTDLMVVGNTWYTGIFVIRFYHLIFPHRVYRHLSGMVGIGLMETGTKYSFSLILIEK